MMRKNRSGWMATAGRTAAAACGLMWLGGMSSAACAKTYSYSGYTKSTNPFNSLITIENLNILCIVCIIVIFVSFARLIIFHMNKKEDAEEDRSMISPEEGSRAEKAAADAVRNIHARQARENAGKWNCAYCDTMVDGEMSKCPACGAGRKK